MRDNGAKLFCCMYCRVLDPYMEAKEVLKRCSHYCAPDGSAKCLHGGCPMPKFGRCPYEKEVKE